jgi:hypothetical protein
MKKMILFIFCSALVFLITGCPYSGPDPEYKLQMYISLGLAGSYPAEYPVNDLTELAEYGGKNVIFSVTGLDLSINDTINIQQSAQFGWTGGDINTSTQYAAAEIDLSKNTMYLAGRYKFRMYIDWDGSGSLNTGDIVFNSYSILADKDGDESTVNLAVTTDEYGTSVVYNAADYSLTIDDPLSTDEGIAWKVTAIHEGEMAVYP